MKSGALWESGGRRVALTIQGSQYELNAICFISLSLILMFAQIRPDCKKIRFLFATLKVRGSCCLACVFRLIVFLPFSAFCRNAAGIM